MLPGVMGLMIWAICFLGGRLPRRKSWAVALWLSSFLVSGCCSVARDPHILHYRYSESHTYPVAIAHDGVTTIETPDRIRSVECAFIGDYKYPISIPQRPPLGVQDRPFAVSYEPGERLLSVVAVKSDQQCNLNIVTASRIYVLRLSAAKDPKTECYYVKFH
jgi:hypothetical protein